MDKRVSAEIVKNKFGPMFGNCDEHDYVIKLREKQRTYFQICALVP